jgi:5-oxoprolinase (ATP-hydrolysing) subunit A
MSGAMSHRIDLNADLAEGVGDDAAMLRIVSSANLCCGAHAGGPDVLRATIRTAVAQGVTLGAHPGYADRADFGRSVVPMTDAAITRMVTGQLEDAAQAAADCGARLAYVKPHGALYNLAASTPGVAQAIAQAIRAVDRDLAFLGLAGSAMPSEGARAGLRVFAEGFADRAYDADGRLVPRGQPGAVLHDTGLVAKRAVIMARDGRVQAQDGTWLFLRLDSLCLHGDTPGAVDLARAVRAALQAAGLSLCAFAAAGQ